MNVNQIVTILWKIAFHQKHHTEFCVKFISCDFCASTQSFHSVNTNNLFQVSEIYVKSKSNRIENLYHERKRSNAQLVTFNILTFYRIQDTHHLQVFKRVIVENLIRHQKDLYGFIFKIYICLLFYDYIYFHVTVCTFHLAHFN